MTNNPLTLGFLQSDPLSDPHPGVPLNPLYNPSNSPILLPLNEQHAFCQVWAVALWDARANLILKLGFTNGNWLMLQLTTAGMPSTPNPTYLLARDALLVAERAKTGGEHALELWT